MTLILSLLHLVWPLVAGAVSAAVAGLAIKWLHSAATIGRLKAKDATDQAAFDDLEHLLDTAVTSAIHQTADNLATKPATEIASDALAVLKTLATPQVLADLAAVAKVTGEAVIPYLLARLTGKAADAKVLAVPPGAMAEFDKMSPAQKRAAIAALGTPTAKLEISHTVQAAPVRSL